MSSQNAMNAMMSAHALDGLQQQMLNMDQRLQAMTAMGAQQNPIFSATTTKTAPGYGLSPERAEKCKHMTVYYITQQPEGSVVKEAKFPLSVFSDDDFVKNYQSMNYPYPAFETRDAAEEYIRNQARMGFRANADALFKKLTDLIFKRGCTGDSETKLLNDMQDYLREDK